MNKTPWTTQEQQRLKEAVEAGVPVRQIARELGRTYGQTQSRYYRIRASLPDYQPAGKKQVACLKCRRPFWSVDKTRNRICDDCKSNADYYDPTISTGVREF